MVITGLVTLALAVAVGLVVGVTATQWLALGVGGSLVLWVGGAISGQVLMARLLDGGDGRRVLDYLRLLMWIIPRFYVPLGLVALGCGLGLVVQAGASFGSPVVAVPLGLYLVTAVAGSAVSAPGYLRLMTFASTHGPDHPDVRRRLLRLAWLNRVELGLVVGAGFVLLASAM
ncbi:MAG: hypothetical protein BGP03_00175 [Pseudonocardia sp. 73-21]|nr:MAG: hypothetical protein BGP03_00175 [Pseudonocardia sp. 73-21]